MSSVTEERCIHNSVFQLGLEVCAYRPSYLQKDHKFEVCLDYIFKVSLGKLNKSLCLKIIT